MLRNISYFTRKYVLPKHPSILEALLIAILDYILSTKFSILLYLRIWARLCFCLRILDCAPGYALTCSLAYILVHTLAYALAYAPGYALANALAYTLAYTCVRFRLFSRFPLSTLSLTLSLLLPLLLALVLSLMPPPMPSPIPSTQEGNGALPPVIASSLAVGTATVNNAPLAEVIHSTKRDPVFHRLLLGMGNAVGAFCLTGVFDSQSDITCYCTSGNEFMSSYLQQRLPFLACRSC